MKVWAGAVELRVLAAGRGAPLVYLHAYHERGGWPACLDRLAERFTVYAPYHPGVQGSQGVESLDDVADLTLAYDELLGALGLASAHLVGHGFGGMMAAELAATVPLRARKVVLVSPLGLWRDDLAGEDILVLPEHELGAVLWKDPHSDAARRWATLPEADADNVAAQIESIQRRAAMAKFVWPIADKGLRKRLHRLTAPTLVLWGDADRANPPGYADEWKRRVPGARVKVMPGGHMLIHESPDATARAVREFLS
ncbi:MAG: alpha/beta hydrolase [Candidatus Rokubacteria bacterium]|nr:alpha/beta hydrolase [Candidatus Rokubacteria bacterium]MBI3827465.1 alpha/beta hydrolase [Candidatus Rokubacteria bacterium]